MKNVVLIATAALLVLGSSDVSSQTGTIGIFSDPAYMDCTLHDDYATQKSTYIVHKNAPGAVSAQFRVAIGGGFTGTFLWFDLPGIHLGDPFEGMTVGYGDCYSGDILIMVLNWLCLGDSPDCAWLMIGPDPAASSGAIVAVDCGGGTYYPTGGVMSVNPVIGVCLGPPDGLLGCHLPPTPVTDKTWGHIKALYH